MTPVVSVSSLTKRFGETVACDSLDLEVVEGEILGLLGPSGCGKTTALRCIAGFEDPSSGEIWLENRLVASSEVSVPPEKRRIGMVFQSYALWPHLTVAGNVGMPLRLAKIPAGERSSMVDEALERLGLSGLQSRYPSELSGGQQQRVALARATVIRPPLLLLDEPLSNLDALLRSRLRDELREDLKKLSITTIFVTHDQAEAMVICDRIALLRSGRLEQIGSPREIYDRPISQFAATFVGGANTLDGTVIGHEGRLPVVEIGASTRLVTTSAEDTRSGDHVHVIVRPEDPKILIESEGPSPNTWSARVLRTLFLGSRTEVHLDISGVVLRVDTQRDTPRLEEGDCVDVSIAQHHALCFKSS